MAFLAVLFVPAIAALAGFALHVIYRSRKSFLFVAFSGTGTLFVWLWACWGLRDGIGPGTDPSSGLMALQEFSRLAWLPLMTWVISLGVAMALRRKGAPPERVG